MSGGLGHMCKGWLALGEFPDEHGWKGNGSPGRHFGQRIRPRLRRTLDDRLSVVRPAGVEPAHAGFRDRCSTVELRAISGGGARRNCSVVQLPTVR
jgi:hypothetical protein